MTTLLVAVNEDLDVQTHNERSGPGLQLDSRYTGSRGWFGNSSGMPSFEEEDSVTGTLKHIESSVAQSGGIVLRWSSGYGAGGQFLTPGFDPRSRHIF